MLEGTKFLHASTQTLSLALRAPLVSKPVETARRAMHKWVSRELKEKQVASVEEYLANATGDLVLLGLWSIVMDQVREAEEVPLYFFARDDRIQKCMPAPPSAAPLPASGAQRSGRSTRNGLPLSLGDY